MPAVVLDVNAGDPLSFSAPVAVGQSLVILLGDGYGNGEQLTAVADAAGNTYDITRLGGDADGDGVVMAASAVLTHPIAAGDALTLTVAGASNVFHAYGVSFPTQRSYDHAAQAGLEDDGTITVTAAAQAGDLLIAFAAFQDALTQDPGNGWIDLLGIGGDPPNNLMAIGYQTATAAGTFTYQPSRSGGPGGDFAAAAIIVLGPVPGASPLKPLTLGTGWSSYGVDPAYYIHAGDVYLEGAVAAGPAATPTILTGLPAPAAPIGVTVPLIRANQLVVVDADLRLALEWPATIGTDGSLTLDDPIPGHVLAAPSAGVYFQLWSDDDGVTWTDHPRYLDPFPFQLALGNHRYPRPGGADVYSPQPLALFLKPAVTDVDSGFAAHYSRNHLAGSVTAAIVAPGEIVAGIPKAMTPEGRRNSAITTVQALEREMEATVTGDTVTIDEPAIPIPSVPGNSPPLALGCPYPRPQTPPTASWTPNATGGEVSLLVPTEPFVTGQIAVPGSLIPESGDVVDAGTHLCLNHFFSDFFYDTCPNSDGTFPDNTFDIGLLLSYFQPEPDWFTLELRYTFEFAQGTSPICALDGDGLPAGCGPVVDTNLAYTLTAPAAPGFLTVPGTYTPAPAPHVTLGSTANQAGGWDGVHFVPDTPLYIGPSPAPIVPDPFGFGIGRVDDSRRLWKRGQASGDLTISFPSAAGNLYRVGIARSYLFLVPYYELPTDYIHAGDPIDLTLTGWPGAGAVSTVIPGPGEAAALPSRPPSGVTGTGTAIPAGIGGTASTAPGNAPRPGQGAAGALSRTNQRGAR